ncbi:putative leucine-rich repeat-containing protein DDB_G0290503 [Anabrus simplex]|uniref:putative leucine-rich repeat-containing protein DDB_G0290503 n=1 Tax=Anabrus simplex TaxID=316456 RepID=UPI0035A35C60
MRELLLLAMTGVLLCWVEQGAGQGAGPQNYRGIETMLDGLKNAMYNLGRLFHDLSDKLERHEYRERQLGDQMKKLVTSLDKRQRTADQRLINLTKTLEERLSSVENSLVQRNERESIQLQKMSDKVDEVQQSMDIWQKKMESLLVEQNSVGAVEAKLIDRLDQISVTMSKLEARMGVDKTRLTETENLRVASDNLLRADSKWRQSLDETARVLHRYEARLAELMIAPTTPEPSGLDDWHAIFLTALESHQEILRDLKKLTEDSAKNLTVLPTREEMITLSNSTADKLEEMRYELVDGTSKAVSKLDRTINEAETNILKGQKVILKAISENGAEAEGLFESIQTSYGQLLKEVQDLSSVEKVLIQTADNVLDTKRRIEYGVHQILLEVGDLIKIQGKDLNATINRRFDNISATILDNHSGSLINLSSKIEHEISQVWRQIGIMYQQLTASANTLDNLQKQTETYVNGSVTTMDSMEGKVTKITARMNEFDENLNHLLGRLSLFTQEFNIVRTKLGEALDNIRNSFRTVQDKIKEVGPGPNPIPEEPTRAPELLPFEITAE